MRSFLLLLVSLSFSLNAQSLDSTLFEMTLEELLLLTVSGSTLTEEDLSSVPAAVTVFTAAQLERMGFETVQELMAIVPGYQSFRSANSGTNFPYSSRGRRISNASAEVLIMVDGQRLDDPVSNGTNSIIHGYPLSFIERIEFIRGPGSAIHGSNAMTGLINIITKTGERHVDVGYGSHDRLAARWLHSAQLGNFEIDLRTHLNKDLGDTFLEPDTFSANTIKTTDPIEVRLIEFDLKWRNTELIAKHVSTQGEDFYNLGGISEGFNEVDAQFQSLGIKQYFSWENLESWLWLSHTRTDLDFPFQSTAPGQLFTISGANDPLLFDAELRGNHEQRIQLHNDWLLSAQSSWQFGAEFRQTKIDDQFSRANYDLDQFIDIQNGLAAPPLTFYGNLENKFLVRKGRNRDVFGLYSQFQHQINKQFRTVIGGRYDRFAGIGEQLSPRAALIFELDHHNTFKLLYGEAYRAPSHAELYTVNNPVVLSNPDLKPETAKTWDLIWHRSWRTNTLSLGVFESRYDDAILQRPTATADKFENRDLVSIKGGEFELTSVLTPNWTIYYNLTRLFSAPDLAYREAKSFGSIMLQFHDRTWQASLAAAYEGERETSTLPNDQGRVLLDDYWHFTGKVRYAISDQVSLHTSIRNLFDRTIRTPAQGLTPANGTPNRGTEVLMGMEWSY